MGYYTMYKLSVKGANHQEFDAIETSIDSVSGYSFGSTIYSGTVGVKWYDYEKDMKSVSATFPHILFELSGEGEESGDLWKVYFKNGKVQHVNAKVVYEPFDENKLK